MTVPQIKVKIQRRAQIKFKALPRFPADVTAASPILLTRTGSNYAFSFDVDALQESLDEVYAAAGDIVDLQATIDGVGGIHPDDPRFGAIRDGSTNTTAEIIEAAEYAASNRLGLFLESGSGGYATTPIQFGGSNPATGTFTGEISGTTLTVTTTPTIPLVRGQSLSGTGVTAGTTIVSFGADTEGWIGTYTVSDSQTVSSTTITATAPSITASFSGTTMTVSAIANGKLFPVDSLVGTGITGGTTIVAQLTGSTGSTGTYTISHPHSLSSRTVRAYPYTLASLPDFILGAPGGQTASVVKAYGSATSPNALWRIVNPAALGAVLGFEIGHIRFDANSIYGTALQFYGFGATSSGGVPHAHDITVSNATNVGMSAVGNVVSAASWGVIEANFTRISGNGNAVTDFHFNGNDGDGTFNSQSITLLDCKANSASSGPGWWFDYTNVVAISCLSQNHTGNALTVNHCNHFEWIDFYSEANGGPFTGDATNSKGVKITGQLIDGVNSALLTSATADIDYNVVGGTRVRNAGVITTQATIAVSPDAGTGKIGASSGAGLQLMGRGSVYDVGLYNRDGVIAGGVLTGTTTVNFVGASLSGAISVSPSAGEGKLGAAAGAGLQLMGRGSSYDVAFYNYGGTIAGGVLTGTQQVDFTALSIGSKTITLGGNFAMSGAYTFTGTLTGNTTVTFPTSGTLATTAGASIPAVAQGDVLYGSASSTLSALAKDTNATRYLSNTGTSNNPAWAQVALGTGISGFGTGIATALAVAVGTDGAPVIKGGALGSPSSAGTLPAYTLGGTVSGGGNQINNVVIGTSSPLAGSFTAIVGTSATINGPASFGTDGSSSVLGPGGTGSLNSSFVFNASSAAGVGWRLLAKQNGTEKWAIGSEGCVTGSGSSTDMVFLNSGSGVQTLHLAISDDAALFAGSVKSKGATQGVGYATGAGGTVTQITSKSTGVTLNKVCGQITTHNQSFSGNVTFTFTNSTIAATDLVMMQIQSGATANSYLPPMIENIAAGSCTVTLRNYSGGALAETLVLNFAVIKAVAA